MDICNCVYDVQRKRALLFEHFGKVTKKKKQNSQQRIEKEEDAKANRFFFLL